MRITYPEALIERQSRVAPATFKVAQSIELASLQATRSFTEALLALSSPLFLATSLTFELVEQQVVLAKQLTDTFGEIFVKAPRKTKPVAPKAPLITTAVKAAARKTDDSAQAAARKTDDAAQAAARKTDDAAQAATPKTTGEDQHIQLRAERLVIDKQRVQHGEARVRKEIVTEMKSFDVPVSREELVIEQYAVTGDTDVDSAPIAGKTIRIALTEEKVNIAKETVVREELEIGKRRIEDVEHINETVRHEELRVDDSTTTPWANSEKLVTTPDDAAHALVTTAHDSAPSLVATAQALAMRADDALVQALATTDDDAIPAFVTTTDEDQEIELREERLVVNKQRVQHGKARVRKEIVTEKKSIDVPVSHEELVIDRHPVMGDVNVDSAPIAGETISIPLTEDQVNITKKTAVREEVEIGKRRVEDVEHISDTVRHEELRVDDPTTNHSYEPSF